MATTLTRIPDHIDAGTTVKWTKTYADYPATEGHTVKFWIAGPGAATSVDGVPNGAQFDFTLSAAFTAARPPGTWEWKEIVTKAATSEEYVQDEGRLVIKANIKTAIAGALQPEPEKRVAIIEAALAGALTDAMRGFSVYGRSVELLTPAELEASLTRAKADLRAFQNPGKFGPVIRGAFPGMGAET